MVLLFLVRPPNVVQIMKLMLQLLLIMMVLMMALLLLFHDDRYNHHDVFLVDGFMMLPSKLTTTAPRRIQQQKPFLRRPGKKFLLLRRHQDEYRSASSVGSIGEWLNDSEEKIMVENVSPSVSATPEDPPSIHPRSSGSIVLPISTRRKFLRRQFNNGGFAIVSAFSIFTSSVIFSTTIVGGAGATPTTNESETSMTFFAKAAEPPQAAAKTEAPPKLVMDDDDVNDNVRLLNYPGGWTGTNLPLVSLDELAATITATSTDTATIPRDNGSRPATWTMGRWPDPILRRPAEPVDPKWFGSSTLQYASEILVETAKTNKAVGLAAQQCGINARMIYISSSSTIVDDNDDGDTISSSLRRPRPLVLVNPRIIRRSDERDMNVWTEECLVLPPTFRATLLRDDWIDVEYDDVLCCGSNDGKRSSSKAVVRLVGEQSRCFQHEYDHDRGILITDHVSLDELENDIMRRIERPGHSSRMAVAYSRSTM